MAHILIVDDEIKLRTALAVILENEGYAVSEAESGEEAVSLLAGGLKADIVITDNRMAGMNGLELLRHITVYHPEIDTIMMTAFADSAVGAQAFKAGALEFLPKPFETADLLTHIRSSIKKKQFLRESVPEKTAPAGVFSSIVGNSPKILAAQKLCQMAAPRDTTIIVRGASGSGKELFVRAIHEASGRTPFVAINCGAIPESLLESELFGHEKGAFTSASASRAGCFERVGKGTLFLDEIGDIPLLMQVKLLRVLQEREFLRVGGSASIKFEGRIICATHRNLERMVQEGTFREDLYFRLNIFPIEVPSLSERKEDIPLLVQHFLKKFGHTGGISDDALTVIQHHRWSGNIRELENSIERAVIIADGNTVTRDALFFLPAHAEPESPLPAGEARSLDDTEKELIVNALEKAGGNKAKAARILNITRRVLYSKLNKHNLQ